MDSDRSQRLQPIDVMDLLDAAERQLKTTWRNQSPFVAMALIVSTLAAHGRMMRFLTDTARYTKVDAELLARARWQLEGMAQSVRTNAGVPPVVVGQCYRYLNAAREEMRRVTVALVESHWVPSQDLPGAWRPRDATPI